MYIDVNILMIIGFVGKLIWWSVFITWLLCKRKKIAKIIKKIVND